MYSDIYTVVGQLLEAVLYMIISVIIEWGAETLSDVSSNNLGYHQALARDFAPVACHHRMQTKVAV